MSERRPTIWEGFWFRPVSPTGLRIVRVVVFGVAAMVLLGDEVLFKPAIADAGPVWDPVSYYRLFSAPPGWLLDVAFPVAIVGCALAAWGLGGRWVVFPSGVLAALVIGLPNNLGKVNHDRNVLVMALLVLAVAPAPRWSDRSVSWRYRWPVAAVSLGYGFMLLFAGFSKLRKSGLDWVLSENLRNVIISENLLLRDPVLSDLALWVAAEPWRWKLAAAATIAGEIGLVVGIVLRGRPWVSNLLIAGGVGVVLGLNLLLDLGGWPLVVLVAALIDWNDVADRLRPAAAAAVAVVVFGGIVLLTFVLRADAVAWREAAMVGAAGATAVALLARRREVVVGAEL